MSGASIGLASNRGRRDMGDDSLKTSREGARFPGRIGGTWEESEPAFPTPPQVPKGALARWTPVDAHQRKGRVG